MHPKITLIAVFITLFSASPYAQQTVSVSGFVTDKATGEVLIGATVSESGSMNGVAANSYGFYSLNVKPAKDIVIKASYVGFQPITKKLTVMNDTSVNFHLSGNIEINEVVVTSDNANLYKKQPITGIVKMDAAMASVLPTLLGEADLARMVQLMPGVQSGKEGSGNLYVRGGSNDQNLVLLDGMLVYNANHIGGFVSIFNPSSVSNLKLYKGGFPARYGGRLSSILDVRMKNGNLLHREGSVSVGTLTSSFAYECPIRKDTSSLIIAGRRTVFDLLVSGYNLMETNGNSNGGYNLWDMNVKYNKKLNDKTRLYISFYKGQDKIFRPGNEEINDEETIVKYKTNYANLWGNTVGSLRLNKVYSTRTFANYTLGVSNFSYKIQQNGTMKQQKEMLYSSRNSFVSSITDYLFLADYESSVSSKHVVQYGLQATVHQFSPSENNIKKTNGQTIVLDSTWGAQRVTVPEIALYASDIVTITPRLSGDVGLRYVAYLMGEQTFHQVEPRLVGNYILTKNLSLKASCSMMNQFTHLISTSDQALPSDFWLPSTKDIRPEQSSQFTLGAFATFQRKHSYEISVDMYYKSLQNLVELKGGTSFIRSGTNWEDQILKDGKGRVFGAEFLIEKKTGKTTGWVSYTLSKNERKFEGINNNEWFPFRYDRRHVLSLVVCHQFNEHINFSANWIFMTGEAVTIPQYKYLIDTQQFDMEDDRWGTYGEVYFYNGKNRFRTPSYHRLDFNFNFVKQLEKGTRTWSLGLYNAYNHYNPYYLFIAKNKTGQTKLFSFTFFPLMPSISYSYKF